MGTEILIAMVVVMVLAAAASAYMSYEMGQQQQKAAKAQAKMLEAQANQQQQLGKARAADIRERNRRMLATMEARAGASGVDATVPGSSPLAALAYTAREAELDALRAEWSGDANAQALTADAQMARFKGDVAAYGAKLQAGTTLLSGASSAGRMYYGATA